MRKGSLFVVAVDFAPDMEATVAAAVSVAKQYGADVHFLDVRPARRPSKSADAAEARFGSEAARDSSRLERLIRTAASDGLRVKTIAYRGKAIETIAGYIQLTKARLLIVGKHYGSARWPRNTMFVSTLTRSAPGPVLVLPSERQLSNHPLTAFRHVVSAIDFTVASAVALRTVVDLIRQSGAKLTVVHALNKPQHMAFSGGEAGRASRILRDQASQTAERLREKLPADVKVDTRVTTSDPHRAILDVASEVGADLLVMGVPSRSRFDELVSGSTLRRVLRRAKVPVLVLPVPAGASEWLAGT
jgi:nucleotide-binding universal stress UspA family protein